MEARTHVDGALSLAAKWYGEAWSAVSKKQIQFETAPNNPHQMTSVARRRSVCAREAHCGSDGNNPRLYFETDASDTSGGG